MAQIRRDDMNQIRVPALVAAAAGVVVFALSGSAAMGAEPAEAKAQPEVKSQPSKFGEPAKVGLLFEDQQAVAGEVMNLGITFDLKEDWHVYWPGINDTGLPPKWTLTLPKGWKELPAVWPTPHRSVLPGDIVDHVLDGKVTIRVPIMVPPDAKADAAEMISAHIDWMVCKEACVLGEGDFKVSVPVVAAGTKPIAPAKALGRVADVRPVAGLPNDGSVTAAIEDGKLVIAARKASKIVYMPGAGTRKPADMVKGVTVDGEKLAVAFDADESADLPVRGIVAVTYREESVQRRAYYALDLTPSAKPVASPAAKPAEKPPEMK